MTRLLALFLAATAASAPASAFDASRWASPTYNTVDVDKLRIQGQASTGNISAMSVTSNNITRPLSSWFTPSGIASLIPDAGTLPVSASGETKPLATWLTSAAIRGLLGSVFPGLSPNLLGGGVPGMTGDNAGFFLYQTNGRDTAPLRVQRDTAADYTGSGFDGVSGTVRPTIWALTGTAQNDKTFSWGVVGELHNRTNAATGSQNVAVNGTVFKELAPGSAPGSYQVGTSWGMNAVCGDKTGVPNPVASCIGIEIDNYAEWTAGTDTGRQRVGAQIAWGPSGTMPPGVPPVHFGYGILLGGAPNSNVIMDRGISLRSDGGGVFGIGIDLVTGVFSGPAIQMAPNQFLAFDADDAGNWSRSLYYTSGTFAYRRGTTNLLQITDAGDGAFSGSVNAPSYRSGSATGVSCAVGTVNVATLQVVNGIVTHC